MKTTRGKIVSKIAMCYNKDMAEWVIRYIDHKIEKSTEAIVSIVNTTDNWNELAILEKGKLLALKDLKKQLKEPREEAQ